MGEGLRDAQLLPALLSPDRQPDALWSRRASRSSLTRSLNQVHSRCQARERAPAIGGALENQSEPTVLARLARCANTVSAAFLPAMKAWSEL
ncbi:MAG: hypothetical protein JWP34_4017 [Massilia sp.]|nr:hypothetical protein [Massilia sp.]